jgi:ABC-type transporter Mla subunit MlaD
MRRSPGIANQIRRHTSICTWTSSFVVLCLLAALAVRGFRFVPVFQLRIFVEEAEDLRIGAPVRLSGLEIGRVEDIRLATSGLPSLASAQRNIEVLLAVEKQYQPAILSDSIATLSQDGLLGGRFVKIERGWNGKPVRSGDELPVLAQPTIKWDRFMDLLHKYFESCGAANPTGKHS